MRADREISFAATWPVAPFSRSLSGSSAATRNTDLPAPAALATTAYAVTSMIWFCTFTLFDRFAIPLGAMGSLTVPDVACAGMLAALLAGFKRPDYIDVSAIAVGAWMLFSGFVNTLDGGTIDPTYLIRYTARIAPYWFAIPLLRRLPQNHRRFLVTSAVVVASAASVCHLYIILTGNVALVTKLYYQWSEAGQKLRYYLALHPGSFLNGSVPDAMPLILSVHVACMAVLASRKTSDGMLVSAGVAALCGVAALVTLERSIGILLVAFMPAVTALRFRLKGQSRRVVALPMLLMLGLVGAALVSGRDITALYLDRFSKLGDDAALDLSRNPRLQDTVHGFYEWIDAPVFGTGLTRPVDFVSETGGDTHGLVSLGLIGGFPLVLLTGLAVFDSLRMGWQRNTWYATAGVFAVVQVLFLMAINTAPGFIWIRSLLPVVVGIAMATSLGDEPPHTVVRRDFRTSFAGADYTARSPHFGIRGGQRG